MTVSMPNPAKSLVPAAPFAARHAAFRPYQHQAQHEDTVHYETTDYDIPTSALDLGAPQEKLAKPAALELGVPTVVRHHDIAFAATDLVEAAPGTVLRGRYLLERQIGVGGSSLVFAALDRHRIGSGDWLALKLLRPESIGNEAYVRRLLREFRQMQRLTHANIARVFDVDRHGNLWFMTMELLQGEPLHRRVREGFSNNEVFEILSQCCAALTHAHELGITHGDLKPGNVFLTRSGGVRLLDFGSVPDQDELAREPRAGSSFAATPAYASPQILAGEGAEPRDDIYSLGCLAYELLSGGLHPFDRKSSLEARQQDLRPAYLRRIQPRHFAVISQALAWERAARPASAKQFLHALLASDLARPISPPARPLSVELTKIPEQVPPMPQLDANSHAAEPPKSADAEQNLGMSWSRPCTVWTGPPPARPPAEVEAPEEEERGVTQWLASVAQIERAWSERHRAESPKAPRRRVTMLGAMTLIAVSVIIATLLRGNAPTTVPDSPPPPRQHAALKAPTAKPVEPIQAEEVIAPPVAAEPPKPASRAAAPRSVVSFAADSVTVSAGQSMAVVTLKREQVTRSAVRVRWSTEDGTARAGIDYEPVRSQVAQFAEGQSVRSLFIPLLPGVESHNARSFAVKLEPVRGGVALGSIERAEVTIAPSE